MNALQFRQVEQAIFDSHLRSDLKLDLLQIQQQVMETRVDDIVGDFKIQVQVLTQISENEMEIQIAWCENMMIKKNKLQTLYNS